MRTASDTVSPIEASVSVAWVLRSSSTRTWTIVVVGMFWPMVQIEIHRIAAIQASEPVFDTCLREAKLTDALSRNLIKQHHLMHLYAICTNIA